MSRKKKSDHEGNGVHNGTAVADPPQNAPPPAPDKPPDEKEKPAPNGPTKSFACPVTGGTIEAAIWAKEIQVEGRSVTVYSVTIHKSYRTDLGEWKHTGYLRGSELHVAIRLLERAETFILDMRTTDDPPF